MEGRGQPCPQVVEPAPTGHRGNSCSTFLKPSCLLRLKATLRASVAEPAVAHEFCKRLAFKSDTEPVHVSFELINLGRDVEFGRKELDRAIMACRDSPDCKGLAESELEAAHQALEAETVQSLRVSDRNTTGLREDNWRALVKTRGLSIKSEEGAGGSHGIGKAAPFAVTALRTVFYWTHYRIGDDAYEWFQGKSVLMSHPGENGETQGTGFYGIKDGCRQLSGSSIPKRFRLLLNDGQPVEGTALHILGFRADPDWRCHIAESVIVNYFYAIETEKLDVIVEPDKHLEQWNLYQIKADSLERWFKYLQEHNAGGDIGEESGGALAEARAYWETLKNGIQVDKQDLDLGHCRLFIKVADGLPSRVGFVRNTGMLITTQQRNLIRFPGCRDFAALCVFEDSAGNEFLRQMENPQHDQFEPNRLPGDQQSRGRRALKRITDWIRAEVRKSAGLPESGKKTVLSELAAYLPDYEPDEPFDDAPDGAGKSTREPGFAERVKVGLKPVRRTKPPELSLDDGPEVDSDGDDTGNEGGSPTGVNGGGGGGGGTGEGNGQGGTGTRGGTSRHRGIPVSRVRILPITGRENCYRLSFMADGDGLACLTLEEAGDSSAISRKDVRAVDENMSLDRVHLTKHQRTVVEITVDGPIDDRAWRLSATAVSEGDAS